jgi:phasin family protein
MDSKTPTDMSAMVSQGVEQARGAMENYLKFFQNNMAASPWAGTELNQKLTDYARQNVDSAFKLAQSLSQAKDAKDMLCIQTEYFQAQLKALTEQAKDLSEAATKSMTGALKSPFK